jgi:hypothetical protein
MSLTVEFRQEKSVKRTGDKAPILFLFLTCFFIPGQTLKSN